MRGCSGIWARSSGVWRSRGTAGCWPDHLVAEHLHMQLSNPPRHAVSEAVGYIKDKSAIRLARTYGEHKQNLAGQRFWSRG